MLLSLGGVVVVVAGQRDDLATSSSWQQFDLFGQIVDGGASRSQSELDELATGGKWRRIVITAIVVVEFHLPDCYLIWLRLANSNQTSHNKSLPLVWGPVLPPVQELK